MLAIRAGLVALLLLLVALSLLTWREAGEEEGTFFARIENAVRLITVRVSDQFGTKQRGRAESPKLANGVVKAEGREDDERLPIRPIGHVERATATGAGTMGDGVRAATPKAQKTIRIFRGSRVELLAIPADHERQQGSLQCNIKGNINQRGERIYHVPGGEYYAKTRINASEEEQWFCTEGRGAGSGMEALKTIASQRCVDARPGRPISSCREVRVGPTAGVSDPGRGLHGRLPVHRGPVQHQTSALRPWLPEPERLRARRYRGCGAYQGTTTDCTARRTLGPSRSASPTPMTILRGYPFPR